MINTLKMMKEKLSNSFVKKGLLIRESFRIFTKSCISKCNCRTLARSSNEYAKSYPNLMPIRKATDRAFVFLFFVFKNIEIKKIND